MDERIKELSEQNNQCLEKVKNNYKAISAILLEQAKNKFTGKAISGGYYSYKILEIKDVYKDCYTYANTNSFTMSFLCQPYVKETYCDGSYYYKKALEARDDIYDINMDCNIMSNNTKIIEGFIEQEEFEQISNMCKDTNNVAICINSTVAYLKDSKIVFGKIHSWNSEDMTFTIARYYEDTVTYDRLPGNYLTVIPK